MRQQSPETRLRDATREARELNARILPLEAKINNMKLVGSMMANICYNLAQRSNNLMADRDREVMTECRKAWDSIR